MARIAVVTGAGGALGAAVVTELIGGGWDVVGVDRDEQSMSRLPDQVRRAAGNLTDPADVERVFATLEGVGCVVHTVGMFRGGAASGTTAEDYRQLMDVNLNATWWVAQAAARRLEEGGGSLVTVAARQGLEPSAGAAAYSVTKAAVVHLVRVLDAELRSKGVRVNAVVPGLIDTAANRAVMSAESMARAVAPEAIARVIGFLVSDDGAPVVGAVVPVCGTG